MATSTTVLFSKSDVEALMIIESKNPRFEVKQAGTVKQTIAATKAWRKEQKVAVELAQALLLTQPAQPSRIDAVLAGVTIARAADGVKPGRKVLVLDVSENPDGSRTLALRGRSADRRSEELRRLGELFLSHQLTVSFSAGEIIVSEPLPGDDCYEDFAALAA